jgi:hypothetical protein
MANDKIFQWFTWYDGNGCGGGGGGGGGVVKCFI